MGRKFFTVSFDDGTEQDIRVIALMEKYGIRGSFNLSSGLFGMKEHVSRTISETLPDGRRRQVNVEFDHNIMPLEQACEIYSQGFIEIAGHGAHHMHQAGLGRARLIEEIAGDATMLSDAFGREIRGHIFPYGEFDEECIRVMEEAGLVYGRLATCGTIDKNFCFSAERGIIEPTCRITDRCALPLLKRFISTPCGEQDMMFILWGHSYELDYGTETGCYAYLEELFRTVFGATGIKFVTNGELIDALE